MQGKTMIYFNPKSGAGKSQRIADQVEIILKKQRPISISVKNEYQGRGVEKKLELKRQRLIELSVSAEMEQSMFW